MKGKRGGHEGFLYAAFFVTLAAAFGVLLGTARMGREYFVPALAMIGIGGIFLTSGPIGRAAGRFIESALAPPDTTPEWQAEADELRARVAELEERLDFTERMLSKAREPERVNGPQG